jgi:hypothetical protein
VMEATALECKVGCWIGIPWEAPVVRTTAPQACGVKDTIELCMSRSSSFKTSVRDRALEFASRYGRWRQVS